MIILAALARILGRNGMNRTTRRAFLQSSAAAAVATMLPRAARAADPVKIALILPLTGPFASTGRQIEAAVRGYMQKYGDTAGGRKGGVPVRDATRLPPA